jgi:uncharacterized integral membrane protein (TIGR00698 family)
VLLAGVLAAAAWGLSALEARWLSQPLIESLVLAILLGMSFRNLVGVGPRFAPGLDLCARPVLELAVLLLGGTMNLHELLAGGPKLLLAVVLAVGLSLCASSFVAGRLLRLPRNSATLIAVGNAICGNSAIAAVAPLIGADSGEVAGAVAFTAVLGVGLVLALPILILPLLQFTHVQYGVLVGMTVYAVPQVLAASFPVSESAGQMAMLVKLTRVLMLLPVALWCSLTRRPQPGSDSGPGAGAKARRKPTLGQLLPGFVVGFLVLAVLRSLGLIPPALAGVFKEVSRILTVTAMAALGLGVELRALRKTGARTAVAVSLSLLLLVCLSVGLIKLFKL